MYGIDPLQTMENAGRAVASLANMLLDGDLIDRPVVILAGRSSNGGCGLAAARHLLNWGAWVQILCTHAADAFTGTAAHQLHTLQAMGAPLAWAEEGWELPPCDLVVDAITGLGLHDEPLHGEALPGEVEGKARDLIQLANSSAAPVLSVDLPSGVDGESGELFATHVRAAATLTLALPKRALLTTEMRRACGDLYLADVGVPPALYEEFGLEVPSLFARDPILRWDVVDGVAQVMDV
jgi:NAD(P)H-hydrate epimerase